MTTTPSRSSAAHDTREGDIAAIEAVIADVERGFNTNDVELSTRHFRADARATGALGQTLTGIDEIVDAHEKGYAGPLRDSWARYTVRDILFLRPDVAIAQKDAREATEDGAITGDKPAMVATYVMSKEEGRWWIVARANTLVAGG